MRDGHAEARQRQVFRHHKEIFELPGEDDHRDARCESGDHRVRNELDQRSHPGEAEEDEDEAGEDGADDQALVTELRDDADAWEEIEAERLTESRALPDRSA